MTTAEHKARHIELHRALDELVADYIGHQSFSYDACLSNRTIMDLIQWSHSQVKDPRSLPGSTKEH